MRPARRAKSSGVAPYMEPITGPDLTAISISAPKSSIPGFGRPMALTYPPSTSVKQGLPWPGFGSRPMDLVTTAPQPPAIIRAREGPVSSMMPEATIPGRSSSSPPMRVLRDAMSRPCAPPL